jgi:hypothetical protein
MNIFTEAYSKAKNILETQKYNTEWDQYFSSKCLAKAFYGDSGFCGAHAAVPDLIREKIQQDMKKSQKKLGDSIYEAATADENTGSILERAACLKMMNHLHRTIKKGGQDVWVYAEPKDYTGWVFDEIKGTEETIKTKLSSDEEIFSKEERDWMSSALCVSLKISEDAKVKLSTGKASDFVKCWFLDEKCGDTELEDATKILVAGFNKITVTCNAANLVFTDYPNWREQRDRYFGGAIRGGEGGGFPIIYLEGAFTRLTGNMNKMWLCAETIIHEFSHHDVSTRDHRYDSNGLKPNSGVFPYAKAIENADSWGYFALDMAGYLPEATRQQVLK